MIEVTRREPLAPAESIEELFARLVRHVGRTILVQHANNTPFAGVLGWLRIEDKSVVFDCGRPITAIELRYPKMSKKSAVKVLVDGEWLELNRPAWVNENSAIERVASY